MIEYNVFPNMKIRCVEINSEEEIEQLKRQGKLDHTAWYATKKEIEEYKAAQASVIISDEEACFENPTNVDVWLKRKGHEWFCLPAHRKIDFRNIEK